MENEKKFGSKKAMTDSNQITRDMMEYGKDKANEAKERAEQASEKIERKGVDIRTPSTDDPAAVLAPDDTFPGSGPSHPDRY